MDIDMMHVPKNQSMLDRDNFLGIEHFKCKNMNCKDQPKMNIQNLNKHEKLVHSNPNVLSLGSTSSEMEDIVDEIMEEPTFNGNIYIDGIFPSTLNITLVSDKKNSQTHGDNNTQINSDAFKDFDEIFDPEQRQFVDDIRMPNDSSLEFLSTELEGMKLKCGASWNKKVRFEC